MKDIKKTTQSNFVSLENYGYVTRSPGKLVRLNISGTSFIVKLETLRRDPMVFEKFMEDAEWLPETGEYYFERDPLLFRFVYCYLRHKELHLPQSMCGPLLEKELEEWGIQLGFDLQRCCLGPVVDSKSKLESLQKFEDKFTDTSSRQSKCFKSNTKWRQIFDNVWNIIGDTPKKRWLISAPNPIQQVCGSDSKVSTENEIHETEYSHETSSSISDASEFPYFDDKFIKENVSSISETEYTPFNWRYLQNVPKTIIYGRIYITSQIIALLLLLMLMFLSYVPELRVSFGPTVDSSFLNGTLLLPKNDILVYRMFFAFNDEERRLTRPLPSMNILILICVIYFTLDLLARAIFSPNIFRWFISSYTITDALSLIPFIVEFFMYAIIDSFENTPTYSDRMLTMLKVLDVVNLLKLFVAIRVLRLLQRKRAARVLLYSIRTSAVNLMLVFEMMAVACIIFGTAVFFVDDAFDGIFAGMWWALVTMATVGYGDVVPSSILGYIIAVFCIMVGILLTSYTIPILVNDFLLYYSHADQLAWMRRVHKTATKKHIMEQRDLMVKRRMSRVRAIIRTKVVGNEMRQS